MTRTWDLSRAIALYEQGHTATEIARIMSQENGRHLIPNTVTQGMRSIPVEQRQEMDRKHYACRAGVQTPPAQKTKEPNELRERLRERLVHGAVNKMDLAKEYHVGADELHSALLSLREEGVCIHEGVHTLSLSKSYETNDSEWHRPWKNAKKIRFGVVSDTHLCSKYQQLTHLETAYSIFEKEGISEVYHAGDLCEGDKMRKGHEYELFQFGADGQRDYIVTHYPYRKGITTHFITGNHDLSHIIHSGYDIGVAIAKERKDMKMLGVEYVRVMLTPQCSMDIVHTRDGASYALSYAGQKYCDMLQGGSKPHIILFGHRHKMMYYTYRNIEVFEAGTLQAQTPFMRGKRIASHVGFWIITAQVAEDGTLLRVVPEYYPFYNMVAKDYGKEGL